MTEIFVCKEEFFNNSLKSIKSKNCSQDRQMCIIQHPPSMHGSDSKTILSHCFSTFLHNTESLSLPYKILAAVNVWGLKYSLLSTAHDLSSYLILFWTCQLFFSQIVTNYRGQVDTIQRNILTRQFLLFPSKTTISLVSQQNFIFPSRMIMNYDKTYSISL